MSRPRIVLADDHRVFAGGLQSLLSEAFEVACIVGDGRALLDAVERLAPDLVVADVSMPEPNGIECVRLLRETSPDLPVVLLTMHDDVGLAAAAIQAGASGYVLKHGGMRDLLCALEKALDGGVHVSPRIAGELLPVVEITARPRPSGEGESESPRRPAGKNQA